MSFGLICWVPPGGSVEKQLSHKDTKLLAEDFLAEDFLSEGAVVRWRPSWERGSRGRPERPCLQIGLCSPHIPHSHFLPRAWVQTQQSCGRVWRETWGRGLGVELSPEFFRLFGCVDAMGQDRASIKTFPFRCSLRCLLQQQKVVKC